MDLLEALGWQVADVEVPSRHSHVTNDLFGWIDVLAVSTLGTLALQVTSDNGGNVSARTQKAWAEPRLKACLLAGWRCEVWGVRNKPTKDGSTILARHFELVAGEVVAWEGSEIL
jgi:hypothetical protein